VTDHEQPEEGTTPPFPVADAGTSEEAIQRPVEVTEVDDDIDEEMDYDEDEAFQFEEDDEEEFDAADDEVRSIVEQIFDESDMGEVMSELDVLTLEDAADYLKVEYGQIRRLIKEQGLPGRKIGDDWRFLRGAIADWLRAPGGSAPAPAAPERTERPAQQDRREFTQQRPPLNERFQQGEGRPQRYPQQGKPPRRYQDDQGGAQGGPPPRKPRYGNDQQAQGEYQPPRRPYGGGGGQGGNFGNQGGGNFSGGNFSGGPPRKHAGGPKKPKRKSLNEQRFKRLDRRKSGNGGGDDSSQ
jgi:excisionase family DNA binding protein